MSDDSKRYECSFCGTEPSPLNMLIAAEDNPAHICSVCVLRLALYLDNKDDTLCAEVAGGYWH